MAAINDPNQSYDEHPMPSQRSTAPSVNTTNRDELLMPENEKKPFLHNNHRLNFNMTLEHQVIIEVLKGHPLRTAFSLDHRVPAFYLQQFWYTMAYHHVEGNPHFTTQIDDYITHLTPAQLHQILHLLVATADHPSEDPVTEEELCNDLRALGYNNELRTPRQFKRMFLPQIWFSLFTLVNRCLTSKHTGMDKARVAVLRIPIPPPTNPFAVLTSKHTWEVHLIILSLQLLHLQSPFHLQPTL